MLNKLANLKLILKEEHGGMETLFYDCQNSYEQIVIIQDVAGVNEEVIINKESIIRLARILGE